MYKCSVLSRDAGECPGSTATNGYGLGACHGGYGGQPVTEGVYDYDGTPYGSYSSPVHRGSGGGGASGGAGGSTINLKVCLYFTSLLRR